VFFVPLSDLSLLLSLFPAYRFPGWQWVLILLAVPVAGWAAWPFHRAALKNAKHGSSSMDTLVSLGIVAACGWSVYAAAGLGQWRRPTAFGREKPSGDGAGTTSGDETGTREHAASCLE
jgi:cation transport ATPase